MPNGRKADTKATVIHEGIKLCQIDVLLHFNEDNTSKIPGSNPTKKYTTLQQKRAEYFARAKDMYNSGNYNYQQNSLVRFVEEATTRVRREEKHKILYEEETVSEVIDLSNDEEDGDEGEDTESEISDITTEDEFEEESNDLVSDVTPNTNERFVRLAEESKIQNERLKADEDAALTELEEIYNEQRKKIKDRFKTDLYADCYRRYIIECSKLDINAITNPNKKTGMFIYQCMLWDYITYGLELD